MTGRELPRWATWLLLAPYPPAFRREYGRDLATHLARQRREARYARPVVGSIRFLWEEGRDALATGLRLRGEALLRGRRGGTPVVPGGRTGGLGAALTGMGRDLRYGIRALSRSPGFVAVFVLTLGLGIGANTAMFSVVNGVLLRPLPHDGADRIVYLRHAAPLAAIDNALFSVPEIDDYRRGVEGLEGVAEFSALTFTLLGLEGPLRVRAGIVTGNYFPVMGLSAAVGRFIAPGDDGPEAPAVMVLTDEYWRRAFGADPAVVGRTLEMNGRSIIVVGVAEPSPPYPEQTDVYVNLAASPHHLDASMSHDRVHRMTEVFARMAPGATVEGVGAEVARVTRRIHADHPEAYDAGSGYMVRVTPLKDQLTARARPTFLLLLVTAFLVLGIACANLANLTLTRVLRRDNEFAVRVSLGGSRLAIRRQLLAESLLLALAGGLLGLLLAFVSLDVLVRFAQRFTSRASEITLDGTVLAYAMGVTVAASVFFTLFPALPGRESIGPLLKRAGGRVTVGGWAKRLQRGMVVAQIGTSCILLVGAGLLVRTMIHLNEVDPGFESTRVLAMEVPVSTAGRSGEEVRDRYREIRRTVEDLPEVEAAALTSIIPLAGMPGTFMARFEIDVEGHETVTGQPVPRADFRVVSPEYFHTLGVEVVAGRAFEPDDGEDGAAVVIINQAMAESYFGGESAIGRRIAWSDEVMRFLGVSHEMRTVVGVVEDTRDQGVDAPVAHTVYNPYPAVAWSGGLILRTAGDPHRVLPSVRRAILDIDAAQPIDNVATLEEFGREWVAPRRLNTVLLGAFGILATVIAAVGIGSVLAFSVRARVKEFGIRRAFGATGQEIRSEVIGEGLTLTGLGLGLGVGGSVLLTRLLEGLLVGVPTWDPVTYGLVAALLGGIAVLACWVPARRAARISPVEALTAE